MKSLFKLSILAISLTLSGVTFAQQPNNVETESLVIDEAEALAMDARIYAENYGVSFDEALSRLTVMLYGQSDADTTTQSEGSDLAGVYFDNGSDFGLVIKTKKPKKDKTVIFSPKTKENYGRLNSAAKKERNRLRKALRKGLLIDETQIAKAEEMLSKPQKMKIKFHKSEVTLEELNQALDTLTEQASNIEGFNFAFVDEKAGAINIVLDREVHQNVRSKLKNIVKVPITIEINQGGMRPVASMRGGSKLYNNANVTQSSSRECMSAFGAIHNATKQTGLVTAAHCQKVTHIIADDGKVYPITLGAVLDNRDTGANEADLRFIYNANNNPLGVGEFYYDHTNKVRKVTGTRSRTSTNINTSTRVGSFVCHLGQETAGGANSVQSCGEVVSIKGRITKDPKNPDGKLLYLNDGALVVVRNTQSGAGTIRKSGDGTLKCYTGDSGGAVFAGTVAFGVVSACSWANGKTDDGPASYMTYTSTDYFSKIGVSIIGSK